MCRRMLSLASVCIGTGLSYCLLKKSNIYCKENLISFIEYFDDPFEKSRDGRLRKYNGVWLPEAVYIANNGFQAVVNFETRDSDVYVASFPKSGNCVQIINLAQSSLSKCCLEYMNTDSIQLSMCPCKYFRMYYGNISNL